MKIGSPTQPRQALGVTELTYQLGLDPVRINLLHGRSVNGNFAIMATKARARVALSLVLVLFCLLKFVDLASKQVAS